MWVFLIYSPGLFWKAKVPPEVKMIALQYMGSRDLVKNKGKVTILDFKGFIETSSPP